MPAKAATIDREAISEAISRIEAELARLKSMLDPAPAEGLDPASPLNKAADGRLTPEGVECCYRLFDEGRSRYSVARAMRISFAAATHRFNTWRKAGGDKRTDVRLG